MKILTYEDYLNSTLNEIDNEIQHSYEYTTDEIMNFRKFAKQFANSISVYEDIILKFEPTYRYLNKNEKCIDTLNRYKEKARGFLN